MLLSIYDLVVPHSSLDPDGVAVYWVFFNVRVTYASMYELHTDLAFQDIRNTSVARVYCGLFTILSRSLYATRRVTTRSRLRSFRVSDI